MAEAQAKVRMTLDGQQFNQQAERMGRKVKEVADSSSKIGQHIEGLPIAMAKAALSAGLIVSSLRSAIGLITEYSDKAAANARTRGAGKTKLFTEQQRAGMTDAPMNEIQSMITAGEISYDDAASVMQRAREAKIKDPNAVVRAVRAKSLGIFGDDEIINEKRRSVISSDDIIARGQRTPDAVRSERQRTRNDRMQEQFPYNDAAATFRSEMDLISAQETFSQRVMRVIGMGDDTARTKAMGRYIVQRVEVVNTKPSAGARGEP